MLLGAHLQFLDLNHRIIVPTLHLLRQWQTCLLHKYQEIATWRQNRARDCSDGGDNDFCRHCTQWVVKWGAEDPLAAYAFTTWTQNAKPCVCIAVKHAVQIGVGFSRLLWCLVAMTHHGRFWKKTAIQHHSWILWFSYQTDQSWRQEEILKQADEFSTWMEVEEVPAECRLLTAPPTLLQHENW